MIGRRRAPELLAQCVRSHAHGLNPLSQRPFSTTASLMVERKDISPSSGSDSESLVKETTALVDNGGWNLCNSGKGLERVFKFKTFKATWEFMDSVAAECKARKHHPEWTNIYNRTHVRWTTHNPEGLSEKDVGMARFCDEVAGEKGELPVESEGEGGGPLWSEEARECCSGKR